MAASPLGSEMFNIEKIKAAAITLELAVEHARNAGYANADCVLTPEVEDLLKRIKAGQLSEAVQLEFTAGIAWHFFETELGECRDLEEAWSNFKAAVEDWDSDSVYAEILRKIGDMRRG